MEFRKMRRFRQQLTQSECDAILSIGTSGTLALLGDNGYPYAVPISYVYAGDKLYFHSAKTGHKVDAIRQYNKASFCVIAADNIHPSEFTTYFRSVIAFGRIQIIESDEERMHAASLLGTRYNPGDDAGLHKELEKGLSHMLVLRLDIEHMTGKEAIELVRKSDLSAFNGQKELSRTTFAEYDETVLEHEQKIINHVRQRTVITAKNRNNVCKSELTFIGSVLNSENDTITFIKHLRP